MQKITEIDGLYHLDPAHSSLGFTVKHAGLSRIRGMFDSYHGYAVIDRDHPADSALMVSVSVASLTTRVADRDAHLRTADFFDVATYPAMTYVATSFEVLDDERVRVGGDLTIKDVTRPLTLHFTFTGGATDPFGNRRIGFEAQSLISRKDFGLTWNAALETGGWLVADEVTLDLEVSAVQQADPAAGLEVDQAVIAGLALEPDEELVAAELARSRAAQQGDRGEAPAAQPSPQTAAADQPAGVVAARRAAQTSAPSDSGAASTQPGRPRRALEEPGDGLAEGTATSWWRRLTGR